MATKSSNEPYLAIIASSAADISMNIRLRTTVTVPK